MPEILKSQPLEAVKVDEKTYRIEDNGVRSLLFIGTQCALLVDACHGKSGSLKAVVSSLTDKPVMLVITHADGDHTGCAHEFDAVHMHPSEMSRYAEGEGMKVSVKPLWEGEVIDIGGYVFEVILIPGHTPGSIALLDRKNRILISGDTISQGPVFMFGDGRNLDAYLESVLKLISRRGEFDTIYSAHGPFPIEVSILDKTLAATRKMLAGELKGAEPPYQIPAKMYMFDGVGFFCD